MSFGIILLIIIVVAVLAAIWVYNNLVALRQRTNQAFADIDVQMKQRHDLIPNLVETVKGYACLLYTSPSPRDRTRYRMPSSA